VPGPLATFTHTAFAPGALAAAKRAGGQRISVCLPARDEAETVGAIVSTIREHLVVGVPLVDEVVVMDDSLDSRTEAAAARAGATVVRVPDLPLGDAGGRGKGYALWASLYACAGDLICWVDADIRSFPPHFVTGLVGPLLADPGVGFVKGFYRRPLDGAATGGGRVTELMARPLLSHLFPHLATVRQPLAGEYAGRRAVLDAVPFVEGWGVELGLLVDISARFGPGAIAQCDLGVRHHRNRSLRDLGPQAMEILVTALRKAGLEPGVDGTHRLVRFDDEYRLETVELSVRERPPMREHPAYRAKHGLELTA
jgi:glucosyl-3-phosphoglycerate synthase